MRETDSQPRSVGRRKLIKTTGGLAGIGLFAGCMGGGGDGGDGGDGGGGGGGGGDGGGDGGSDGGGSTPTPSEMEQMEQAARDEGGELAILHQTAQELQDGFFRGAVQERFPWLDFNLITASETGQVSRFISEYNAGNPTIDAVWTQAVFPLIEEGMLINLEENLPAYADLPDSAKGGSHWAPWRYLAYGMFYNTDLMDASETPENWGDLATEDYSGDILMSQLPKLSVIAWAVEEYGDSWLPDFAANDVRMVPGSGAGIQQLAAGERPMMAGGFIHYLWRDDRAAGTPIEQAPNFTQVPLIGQPFGISKRAPNSATAKFFHNWLLTEEGSAAFAEGAKLTCFGTANNIRCNPSQLQDLVSSISEKIVVDRLAPAEYNEWADRWRQAMGL